jgi:hypothetical protein
VAMGTYKLKRLIIFLVVGAVSPMVCFFLFFMLFPLMGILVWSLVVGLILAGAGYIITGANAWVKAIQGDSLIVIDVNSTGVGKFYNATVNNNPFGGIDLKVDFGGGETETRAYDRKVTHRIQSPLKLLMQPWNKKSEENVGELEKKISFSIPKDEYEKCAWHYDYLTMLFYDSETGMFLTKPYMREVEKQMQAEYLSLNEWRELKELNKTMRDFTRSTFDLIGQKFGVLFGNPIVKFIIIIAIVVGAIILLIMAFPTLMSALTPAVKSTAQVVGTVVQPSG